MDDYSKNDFSFRVVRDADNAICSGPIGLESAHIIQGGIKEKTRLQLLNKHTFKWEELTDANKLETRDKSDPFEDLWFDTPIIEKKTFDIFGNPVTKHELDWDNEPSWVKSR